MLNAVGFMSAMAEEDTRNAISEAPNLVFLLSIFLATCFYTALAFVFRRAELKLREEAGEVSKPMVDRYQRYFQIARIAVIWVSNGLSVLIYFGVS